MYYYILQFQSQIACCGNNICGGCMHAVEVKAYENASCKCAKCIAKVGTLCPFCRKPASKSQAETVKRLKKQIAKNNDPTAISILGSFYSQGSGVHRSIPTAIALWEQAAALGCAAANGYMGDAYNPMFDNGLGLPQDQRDWHKAVHYYKMAAKGGHEQVSTYFLFLLLFSFLSLILHILSHITCIISVRRRGTI